MDGLMEEVERNIRESEEVIAWSVALLGYDPRVESDPYEREDPDADEEAANQEEGYGYMLEAQRDEWFGSEGDE